MHDHEAAVPVAGVARGEERVSTLVGDRLCSHCGYNLMGQPVLREPHYSMLIVRCPECATIAAPQEYPLAGRWTNRFVAMGSALVLLFALLFFIGTKASLLLASVGITQISIESARTDLQALASQHVPNYYNIGGTAAFNAWLDAQPPGAVVEQLGGWNAIEWQFAFFAFIPTICAFFFGVIWSVILIHWPTKRLPLFALLIFVIFACIGGLLTWSEYQVLSPDVSGIVWREFGLPLYLGMIGVYWIAMFIGLMVGRPIARLFIRAFLAPRLRGPMSFILNQAG
jgi:hypothetical protein